MGNPRSIRAIMRIIDDDRHAERVDPTIVGSPRLIYADGRHNIAPDVTRWKGQYYLTFSNGSNHRVWDHHGIVMRCDNLRDWTKSYHTPHQARDPFFCAMPDRLLMYYIHYENPHDIEHGWPPERTVETKVTYTDDGETCRPRSACTSGAPISGGRKCATAASTSEPIRSCRKTAHFPKKARGRRCDAFCCWNRKTA